MPNKAPAPPPDPDPYITTALIEETTGVGVEEHNVLDELEIIFAALRQVAPSDDRDSGRNGSASGLHRCARLRRLSLVDCGIERLGSLRPIAQTLERLCVADQRLTSLRDLGALPQLRWLYAQQNAIVKMDGLDACPRLRSVWLFSNKISRIEGLSELGELRELWLQENRLARLGGATAARGLGIWSQSWPDRGDAAAKGRVVRGRDAATPRLGD